MPTPASRKIKRPPQRQLVRRKLPDAAPEQNDRVDSAIAMLDLDGTAKSPNTGAHRSNGDHAQEIIGSDFRLFFSADEVCAGEPERSLETARTSGRFENNAWRGRKDGTLGGLAL